MTLEEAIVELQEELNFGEGSHERELEEALKLGIEALKRVKWNHYPLPSETKE